MTSDLDIEQLNTGSPMLQQAMNFLSGQKPRLQELGVRAVGLFGSVVRGEEESDSDIDIVIDLSPNSELTLFSLLALEQEFTERLGRKVDLVIQSDLKPHISESVLREVQYV